MRNYVAEIGLIITAIIWGSGFVASAIALEFYTPHQIMAIRFLSGSLVLALLFRKRLSHIPKSTLLMGILLGLLLYTAFLLQTVGLQFTTPSKNAFLTAVNVVLVPIIGLILFRKKLNKWEVSGAFLTIIGVALLSLHLPFVMNIGDMLSLGCAVFFALQIIYTAKFVQTSDAIVLTVIQMATAAFCGLATITIRGELSMSFQPEAILPVLYLGIFSTSLAYVLQTTAQKQMSETKTAIILSTESLWGMVFSILILQEVVTFKMAAGASLILLAILVTETKMKWLPVRKMEKLKSD